jgi:RHS repeat-associated protein
LTFEDGEDNEWSYTYHSTYPTLLIQIDQPVIDSDDGSIVMDYYDNAGSDGDLLGLLKSIQDPNGVLTEFRYDDYGQPERTHEGRHDAASLESVVNLIGRLDGWSRPIGSGVTSQSLGGTPPEGAPSECFAEVEYNDGDEVKTITCGACFESFDDAFDCKIEYSYATSCGSEVEYDWENRQFESLLELCTIGDAETRNSTLQYDVLGRMISSTIEMDMDGESSIEDPRTFTYSYSLSSGHIMVTRTGPDGVVTRTEHDEAGRVISVTASDIGDDVSDLLSASYTYFDDGRVDLVTYGNGMESDYEYDAAGRLDVIEHRVTGAGRKLRLEYDYDDRDLITGVDEYDEDTGGTQAQMTYDYDDRGRLDIESRAGDDVDYAHLFEYDQGGNRTQKIVNPSTASEETFVYTYDISNPARYRSFNNRLMVYERFDDVDDLIEKVTYRYDFRGNPTKVTRLKPTATAGLWEQDRVNFIYGRGGEVKFVVGEEFLDYEWFDNPETGELIEFALDRTPRTLSAAESNAGDYAAEVAQIEAVVDYEFIIDRFGDAVGDNTELWMRANGIWQSSPPEWLYWQWPASVIRGTGAGSFASWIGSGDSTRGWFASDPEETAAKNEAVFVLKDTGELRPSGYRNVEPTEELPSILMRVKDVPDECYTRTFAYEFRYDSMRARYMARELAPNGGMGSLELGDPLSPEQWHDYDGDMIYRDWIWPGDDIQLGTFHLPGIGQVTSPATGEDPIYVHTDHLGTTRLITDNTETGGNPDPKIIYASIFSAFGEVISIDPDGEGTMYSPPNNDQTDRYGYVGAHGYQAHTWHDEEDAWFPFQHVGARYYDPSTGRFLQRDPIGIQGGLNVYVYVDNNPMKFIDPLGYSKLWDKVKDGANKAWDKTKEVAEDLWDVAKELPPYIFPSSPIPAEAAPGIANCYMNDALRRHVLEQHVDTGQPDLENCPACKRLKPKSDTRKF